MATFSSALEKTLRRALAWAVELRHEYVTLEHLLFALTDDADAMPVMLACKADLGKLRADLTSYAETELDGLVVPNDQDEPRPTAGFQRVLQRAMLHVDSSGAREVTGANVLVALFSERESHAAYFLAEQGMTRYDVINFIAHGLPKSAGTVEPFLAGTEQGPGPDVLIVCVREDEPQAKALAEMFEAAGFSIGGAPTNDSALRSSGAGVVVWSQASIRSRPFLDAAQRVINAEKAVVASLIEPPPPEAFQGAPVFELSTWDGDPNDPALDALFFAVDRLVNSARVSHAAAVTPADAPKKNDQDSGRGGRRPVAEQVRQRVFTPPPLEAIPQRQPDDVRVDFSPTDGIFLASAPRVRGAESLMRQRTAIAQLAREVASACAQRNWTARYAGRYERLATGLETSSEDPRVLRYHISAVIAVCEAHDSRVAKEEHERDEPPLPDGVAADAKALRADLLQLVQDDPRLRAIEQARRNPDRAVAEDAIATAAEAFVAAAGRTPDLVQPESMEVIDDLRDDATGAPGISDEDSREARRLISNIAVGAAKEVARAIGHELQPHLHQISEALKRSAAANESTAIAQTEIARAPDKSALKRAKEVLIDLGVKMVGGGLVVLSAGVAFLAANAGLLARMAVAVPELAAVARWAEILARLMGAM